ncbi:MAG: glycosyltransferase 28 domain-containing protein, partial [uncultured Nocardioides sp.]
DAAAGHRTRRHRPPPVRPDGGLDRRGSCPPQRRALRGAARGDEATTGGRGARVPRPRPACRARRGGCGGRVPRWPGHHHRCAGCRARAAVHATGPTSGRARGRSPAALRLLRRSVGCRAGRLVGRVLPRHTGGRSGPWPARARRSDDQPAARRGPRPGRRRARRGPRPPVAPSASTAPQRAV